MSLSELLVDVKFLSELDNSIFLALIYLALGDLKKIPIKYMNILIATTQYLYIDDFYNTDQYWYYGEATLLENHFLPSSGLVMLMLVEDVLIS